MKQQMQWPVLLLGALAISPTGLFAQPKTSAQPASNANARRAAVIQATGKGVAGLPTLTAAMKDKNVVVRRTAVRGMAFIGAPAKSALTTVLRNDADPLVRRTALRALMQLPDSSAALLGIALKDSDPMIRLDMVRSLAAQRPMTAETTELLKQAQKDPSPEVSRIATSALWPFHKVTISARERPDTKDNQLKIASTIALPLEGWRFHTDSRQDGHLLDWYGTGFDDSKWETIGIGKAWEDFGHTYDGVAWYRDTFNLPAKPATVGVDLFFEAVDESAWVWINGQYAGQHDIGPEGWDLPFRMEVTNLLKWGEPNQITVRVLDRKFAGGIWKPVSLEVLTR